MSALLSRTTRLGAVDVILIPRGDDHGMSSSRAARCTPLARVLELASARGWSLRLGEPPEGERIGYTVERRGHGRRAQAGQSCSTCRHAPSPPPLTATITFTFAALPAAADATSSDDTARWHAGLELDPIPFALGGYGGLLSVRPDRRWKIGVSSFSVPYPDGLISDDNAGFHLDIRPSGVVMVNYSLTTTTRRGSWFVTGIARSPRRLARVLQ